jgi:hypothetical protein
LKIFFFNIFKLVFNLSSNILSHPLKQPGLISFIILVNTNFEDDFGNEYKSEDELEDMLS